MKAIPSTRRGSLWAQIRPVSWFTTEAGTSCPANRGTYMFTFEENLGDHKKQSFREL